MREHGGIEKQWERLAAIGGPFELGCGKSKFFVDTDLLGNEIGYGRKVGSEIRRGGGERSAINVGPGAALINAPLWRGVSRSARSRNRLNGLICCCSVS